MCCSCAGRAPHRHVATEYVGHISVRCWRRASTSLLSCMSLVRVFRTALDVDAVERHADALAACANFWIPRERLEAGDVATAVEREVCGLLHGVLRELLPPTWSGAEYWVQVRGVLAQPPT